MKVLNNVVAGDIRMFLMSPEAHIGKLVSLEKFLASETGELVYNAKVLMVDIEKIVSEIRYNEKNLKILNILLNGLGVIYAEDSLFYKLGKNKKEDFLILYDLIFSKKIRPESEIGIVLVKGALNVSFITELLIEDARDILNVNDENLILMSKWDNFFKMYLNKEVISADESGEVEAYKEILTYIGECILDHLKFIEPKLQKESLDILFQNMRLYKMIGPLGGKDV